MNRILSEDIQAFVSGFPLVEGLRGKTVLVTGATGLIGSCAVRSLLAMNAFYGLGLHVVAVVRNMEKAFSAFGGPSRELSFYEYDFAGRKPFCPGRTPFYIIHLASPTASRYFVENPVETLLAGLGGTETVLEYARKVKPGAMVYVSSLEVYGTVYDDGGLLTEDKQGYLDPTDVRSSYPMGKRAAECLCHAYAAEYGVPVRIARLAQTFGAGVSKDDSRVYAQFARDVIANEDIVLHTRGELCRCYCYTTDAVSSLLYLLMAGENGEAYNVANEDTYISILDMARLVCREFNPGIRPVVELKDGMGFSPVTKLRLSTEKLRRLGWQPRYGLREMFGRLIEYMRGEYHDIGI